MDDRALQPAAQTSLKHIAWLDGDISNSQRYCRKPILKLIMNHLTEFESGVAATKWPPSKGVTHDAGRIVRYVHVETDEEVAMARYQYGKNSQFFVVWLPGKTTNDPPEPAICKFQVYDGTVITRHGQSWKAITWKTWVLRNIARKSHTIWRCVPSGSAPAQSAVASSRRASSVKTATTSRTAHLQGYISSDDEQISLRPRSAILEGSIKRKRTEIFGNDETTTFFKRQKDTDHQGGTNGLDSDRRKEWLNDKGSRISPPRDAGPNPHATRSPTRVSNGQTQQKESRYFTREPVKKGPNLTCVFQDKAGTDQEAYPYDECDTAQKLFDVACVDKIAHIEPPPTRLLKISFDGGGEGRLRPDNQNDFTNIFEAELNKLISKGSGASVWTVAISPYL